MFQNPHNILERTISVNTFLICMLQKITSGYHQVFLIEYICDKFKKLSHMLEMFNIELLVTLERGHKRSR